MAIADRILAYLDRLNARNTPPPVSEIAAALGVTPKTVSTALRGLAIAGLVHVDLYWAPGRDSSWRYVPPTRATVVTGERVRIVRQRCGPVYLVSEVPDPNGNAVVVNLHHPTRIEQRAVPIKELRGLWKETLAATGRTEAGVKAHDALIAEIVATPATQLTDMHLLRVAAQDEGVDDDTFGVLARQLA